jgi:hypothetical protein
MGANAQTTVPLFVANAVLTAAQQNISAATGIPVFATTVTRDAAFGGSNKALAEGQLCYLESTDVVQYYTGAAWATVGPATAGALVLISATTIGTTVSSVTVSSAFSTTYDNYKIIVSGGVGTGDPEVFNFTLGATAAGYYSARTGRTWANADGGNALANGAQWYLGGITPQTLSLNAELFNPFLADQTSFSGSYIYANTTGQTMNATSYTAFTIAPNGGTITGGTIYVYGYAKA